jgi:hypothetical protein
MNQLNSNVQSLVQQQADQHIGDMRMSAASSALRDSISGMSMAELRQLVTQMRPDIDVNNLTSRQLTDVLMNTYTERRLEGRVTDDPLYRRGRVIDEIHKINAAHNQDSMLSSGGSLFSSLNNGSGSVSAAGQVQNVADFMWKLGGADRARNAIRNITNATGGSSSVAASYAAIRSTPFIDDDAVFSCGDSLEPIATLRNRMSDVYGGGSTGLKMIDNRKILASPQDVWFSEEERLANMSYDELEFLGKDLYTPDNIEHRLVSTSLVPLPIDCGKVPDENKAAYRRTAFSPKPASYNSIVAAQMAAAQRVPVIRLVTGDDRTLITDPNGVRRRGNDVYNRASRAMEAIANERIRQRSNGRWNPYGSGNGSMRALPARGNRYLLDIRDDDEDTFRQQDLREQEQQMQRQMLQRPAQEQQRSSMPSASLVERDAQGAPMWIRRPTGAARSIPMVQPNTIPTAPVQNLSFGPRYSQRSGRNSGAPISVEDEAGYDGR